MKYSDQHREEMKARFRALLEEIKSGVNFDPEYGKLQPGEKPRHPHHFTSKRTPPPSWLEKWERDNGRPYFPVYPKAAE